MRRLCKHYNHISLAKSVLQCHRKYPALLIHKNRFNHYLLAAPSLGFFRCHKGACPRRRHAQYSRSSHVSAFANLRSSPNKPTSNAAIVQRNGRCRGTSAVHASSAAELKAIIFDCDGVILESEDLHRRAYNAAFDHFEVRVPAGSGDIVRWSSDFYDDLQNRVGGGKPKMRHFFGDKGWPSSNLQPAAPQKDSERETLIDTLQDWKTQHYQELIGSGKVKARPGIIRLMEEARADNLKLAVCSAATKSSVIFVVEQLLGRAKFEGLDVFMAGDDVPEKKPDPSIYVLASGRLGVKPEECLVIEDSTIGLRAAQGAGMRCVITYTSSTASESFSGAERIFSDLPETLTVDHLRAPPNPDAVFDERKEGFALD